MKNQKLYQIDAFADSLFKGNPAAVCVLEEWLDDKTMQFIAMENNLAETAFVVKDGEQYLIRWFTPEIEVDLCGHATLASAYVLFNYENHLEDQIQFYSDRSGALTVTREKGGFLTLNFPTDLLEEVEEVKEITDAIGIAPLKTLKGKTDYLLIFENERTIREIKPNFFLLNEVDARGVIVSAPGDKVDVVSRFFAPMCGIPEDPVTGSAHTTLTPYWSNQLGKKQLVAQQLSERGGTIYCTDLGERVLISGKAVPYMIGEIFL